MPTYAYRCSTCSHEFDVFQKFSEAPLTECPNCGGPIHRVFQPVGVVFKGSGWYINDSRAKPANGNGNGGATDTAAKADKPETKPEKSSDKTAPATAKTTDSSSTSKAAAD